MCSSDLLRRWGGLLGLLQRDPEEFLRGGSQLSDLSDADIEALIAARTAAKQRKDYAQADRIRDDLMAKGIVLEDGAAAMWCR